MLRRVEGWWGDRRPSTLYIYNLICCAILFLLLECWRPCYFLSDDNLSSLFPAFAEMGRHMMHGRSPFVSDYLFGGHYDLSRDIGCLYWHPFYLLPTFLANTGARFWMLEVMAFLFVIFTTVGFTALSNRLREQFDLNIENGYLVFYTMSYVFCTYILTASPSWLNFLGNQAALPWLVFGMLDKSVMRGTLLVAFFTINQFVGSYAGMTFSTSLFLTFFAGGLMICTRTLQPGFIWAAGSAAGLLMISPFLVREMDGFAHALRQSGLSLQDCTEHSIPASIFPVSFFMGNWSKALESWAGDPSLDGLAFPYLSMLLACGAAWLLVPVLINRARWKPIEILLAVMAVLLMVLIIRPIEITKVMIHLPLFRSMRWPFRESLQFLFFVHLFLIFRHQVCFPRLRAGVAIFSLAMFVVPLPFYSAPTFNPLLEDRKLLFSGEAEAFGTRLKALLKPGDEVATVIDRRLWNRTNPQMPYSAMCTANFPILYGITCISGYATTAPRDQIPLKSMAGYWFGAFDMSQVPAILAEKPDLVLITVTSAAPLKISLTRGHARSVDISPLLPKEVQTMSFLPKP